MSKSPLSARELELWNAFKRMGETLLARVGADIEKATELSGSEFGVLSRLMDLGKGQLSQQELAKSLGWHKSRLSHQLTRMEHRGFLKRTATPGRSVSVSISPQGRKRLSAARPVHAASIRRNLVTHLTAQQAEVVLEISSKILAA